MGNGNNNGFKAFLLTPLGKAAMIVVLYIVILLLFTFLIGVIKSDAVVAIAAICFGIFGWRALNRITPDMFLFLSITGWIVYFCIKGALSIAIGVFVTPFLIARRISEAVQYSI